MLLARFLLGWGLAVQMAGSRLVHQLRWLLSAFGAPRRALGDSAVLTLATVLILLPEVVTTAFVMLLLVPPLRTVAGYGLAAMTLRGLQRWVPLVTAAFATGARCGSTATAGTDVEAAQIARPSPARIPRTGPTLTAIPRRLGL